LERVEGYEVGLHGFVVSQEPACGAEVAADSQVFLYVAAPSRTVVGQEAAPGDEAAEVKEDTEEGPGEEEVEEEPVEPWPEANAGGVEEAKEGPVEPGPETGLDGEPEAEEEYPSLFEETDTAEFEVEEFGAEASDAEESDEAARVWRGPAPGAVPRRRLTSPRPTGQRRLWRSLPLSVQLAAVAPVVVTVLALLVGLADQGHHASLGARQPRRALTGGRSGDGDSVAASPAVAVHPQVSVVIHAPRRRVARHVASAPRLTTDQAMRRTVAGRAGAPNGGGELSGSAAEEHAALEFGP
jgi:hypothetical protein